MNDHAHDNPPRTSRRLLLGAIPAVALAAACGSNNSNKSTSQASPETTTTQTVPPAPAPATPDEAIKVLMDGNARFAARQPQIRDTAEIDRIWAQITQGQQPFATVLGCADSRLGPEVIFDQFVGDIFVVREAGNIAESPTSLGTLEFGHAALKSKALMVLGHSACGAVKAAFENATPGANIQAVVDAIKPGIAGAKDVDDAIARNVQAVIDRVRKDSTLLRDAEQAGAYKIVGAVYDIATATVRLL